MNKLLTVIASVGLFGLVGCTSYTPQPRALSVGPLQPFCLFLCTAQSNTSDAEAAAQQTSTLNSSATVSPTIDKEKKGKNE